MRKTFAIVFFYIYMNASAVLLEVSGITAAWGVESPTGVTAATAEMTKQFSEIQASGGLADTLFGSFSAAASGVQVMVAAVGAFPLLMESAGVPAPFVVFLFTPAFLITGRDILHALTGRFA